MTIIGANQESIGLIVQCREKSTRLPNKWKLDLDGHIVLWHVLARCQMALAFCRIPVSRRLVVAIPEGDKDLKSWLEENQFTVFEGPEDDVLTRYVKCREEWGFEYVIRVTADCPLIDPVIIATIINAGVLNRMDYCSNTIERYYPNGYDCEVISRRGLNWLNEKATGKDREHVTSYLLDENHLLEFVKEFRYQQFPGNIDLSDMKLSIDTEIDYARVKKMFGKVKEIRSKGEKFYKPGGTHE